MDFVDVNLSKGEAIISRSPVMKRKSSHCSGNKIGEAPIKIGGKTVNSTRLFGFRPHLSQSLPIWHMFGSNHTLKNETVSRRN
jgi:hypothetical protein